MASTGFFRHPNGDERRVALTKTGRDKALVAVASVASDISNAVKFLTRMFEGYVADGSPHTELFLAGKLKLAVVCKEFHAVFVAPLLMGVADDGARRTAVQVPPRAAVGYRQRFMRWKLGTHMPSFGVVHFMCCECNVTRVYSEHHFESRSRSADAGPSKAAEKIHKFGWPRIRAGV